MKRRDVFIQILHEVSGKPKDLIRTMIDAFLATGVRTNFDEDISVEEYESILAGLRKEKEGIKALLMRGHLDFVLRHGKPAGQA